MVSEGAGVALVDSSIELSGKFGDLRFRPFHPTIPVSVQLIYPRERPRSRGATQFAEALRRTIER
jgi:DNA-binding transcriptional LysR family regulator